jgi:hypothetical protein
VVCAQAAPLARAKTLTAPDISKPDMGDKCVFFTFPPDRICADSFCIAKRPVSDAFPLGDDERGTDQGK